MSTKVCSLSFYILNLYLISLLTSLFFLSDSSYFLLRLISITGYSEHKGGHALQC